MKLIYSYNLCPIESNDSEVKHVYVFEVYKIRKYFDISELK